MSTATRVTDLGLSPIRRMAVGAPAGTVSLGLGEPGWPMPEVARRALAGLAGGTGPLPYGPNAGRAELVAAVAAFASTEASTVDAEQVMVTAGSQAALFALFQAHVEPGSTVLVPDPGFVSYPTLARLCGAEPVGYPLGAGGDLHAEALVETLAAHPHTSLVVLNHPANPTGGRASAAALLAVAAACAERGVLLLSDEVYRELWVDERPASLHDVAGIEAGVVLGSVSKAFGAPGLRVGWAVGTPQVLAAARIVHNAMNTAPAAPSQEAAVALLREADEVLAEARAQVRVRWETVARVAPRLLERTDDHSRRPDGVESDHSRRPDGVESDHSRRPDGVESDHSRRPDGRAGIYLWLPLPEEVPPERTEEFALQVRDEHLVTTVPGSAFGPRGAGYLRVGVGGPTDELEEGLRRLAPRWER